MKRVLVNINSFVNTILRRHGLQSFSSDYWYTKQSKRYTVLHWMESSKALDENRIRELFDRTYRFLCLSDVRPIGKTARDAALMQVLKLLPPESVGDEKGY